MSYDYVRRTYCVSLQVGGRVRHTVTDKYGVIAREDKSQSHYVMVRFDGQSHRLPCHPHELEYLTVDSPLASALEGDGCK